ncbi:TonB-dependent siderophore receptor [uncultured Methylobacterium sp.]|uniref:TonB-dependent receptor n=1 Tax=uncultured Methylobacterium sp. TaxID=157278 RepID=UPI00261C9398|nr:TonB-dependent siderophore receptor [uncultured Methylobacterium sp.]
MPVLPRHRSPERRLARLLLVSAGLSAAPASGEEAGTIALDAISVAGRGPAPYTAAPAGLNLTTPSRSGSRLGLSPIETPASIEIIPGQKIRERGQETVAEAVTQNATGITSIAAPGNGFTSYTSRGFAGPDSVMQLYDGTRLFVGNGTITFPFDTWNVDRIEVLRGPASVLYGEGAIGGVVNVVPKKPTFVAINEARAAVGSDAVTRLALDSGGPLGESVAYRLNVSANRAAGWLRENGDFQNIAVSGALLWQVAPDLAVSLSHDFGYQEPMRYFGTPLVDGGIDPRTRFRNYNVDDGLIRFRDNWTQLKTEWTPNADVTVRNTAYYLTSNRHWRNVETYATLPGLRQVERSDYVEITHDQAQIGNRFDVALRGSLFGLRNEGLVGFEVNHIDFQRNNNAPYGGVSRVDPFAFDPGAFLRVNLTGPDYRSSTDQAAIFAEDRLFLTDRLSLVAGLRYEAPTIRRSDLRNPANDFSRSFQALTYRVGAVFNPTPDSALYVQYATAVDPVTGLISLPVSQRDFRLSTGRQVEIGVKQAFWGGRGEFTLAGYRITKDNLITVDINTPGIAVQVGSQSAQGVEAFVSLGLSDEWRVEGNLALLHAQYDRFAQSVGGVAVSYAGNQPQNVPELVGNLWLTWAFAPRWEARAGVQVVGETYGDFANTARRDAYAVVNATLDYRVTEASRLSLRAYNLTDETYAITGSSTAWLLGRPRSFEVAYSVAF